MYYNEDITQFFTDVIDGGFKVTFIATPEGNGYMFDCYHQLIIRDEDEFYETLLNWAGS